MLQQEIAEELERERKRNKKELSALQHTNVTILRQRDEAQRVVLHLRSLISGQTHHMEHIVRQISKNDLNEYLEQGYGDEVEDLEDIAEEGKGEDASRATELNGDDLAPEMESRLVEGVRRSKRYSQMSIIDVADRHLRDKTDAIAHIIRNISEQCAAAVEGLQLAHDAEVEAEELALASTRASHRASNLSILESDDGKSYAASTQGSENGEDSLLHPSGRSSIPPTPDLIHNRSSTSMSINSATTTPERSSQQYNIGTDIPTKIVEDSDEELQARSENEGSPIELSGNGKGGLLHRPAGARISALGGS